MEVAASSKVRHTSKIYFIVSPFHLFICWMLINKTEFCSRRNNVGPTDWPFSFVTDDGPVNDKTQLQSQLSNSSTTPSHNYQTMENGGLMNSGSVQVNT